MKFKRTKIKKVIKDWIIEKDLNIYNIGEDEIEDLVNAIMELGK